MPFLRWPRRARHLVAPMLVAASACIGACADMGTNPNAPTSIEFTRLASPSILTGDTLRDLQGLPAHLPDSVWVFNQGNDTIAPSQYVVGFVQTIDSARLRYEPDSGFLLSTAPTGVRSVGIQAQVSGLFTPPVNITIVPTAPTDIDTIAADSALAIGFNNATGVSSQSSVEFAVKVYARSKDSVVTGWPVEFTIVSLPPSLESASFIAQRGDTTRTSRPSPWDTTSGGAASRFIRATRKADAPAGTSATLVVQARIRVRRTIVDSVRFDIPVTFQ